MLFFSRGKLLLLGLVFSLLVLSSCSEKSNGVNHIPSDAAFVGVFDVGAMKDKSTNWSQILSVLRGDVDDMTKMLLNSGVDLSAKAYTFASVGESAKDNYIAILLQLSDGSQFEATVKGEIQGMTVEEKDGIKLLYSDNRRDMVIAITEGLGVIITRESPVTTREDMMATATKLCAQPDPKQNLIGSNENFKTFHSGAKDISLWTSLNKLAKYSEGSMGSFGLESMTDDETMESSYSSTHIEFKNGEIVADAEVSGGDELGKALKVLSKNGSGEMAATLPANKPILLLNLSFDIQEIFNNLAESEEDKAAIDEALSNNGLESMEFVTSTFSGDLTAIISTGDGLSGLPIPDATVAFGVKNPNNARKVIDQFVPLGLIQPTNDKSYQYDPQIPMAGPVDISIRDKAVVATFAEGFTNKFKSGAAGNLTAEEIELIESGALSYQMNFNRIPSELLEGADLFLGLGVSRYNPYFAHLETLSAKWKVDGNSLKGSAKLSLVNKEENSLTVLMQMLKGPQNPT